jgi:hypothetical protein
VLKVDLSEENLKMQVKLLKAAGRLKTKDVPLCDGDVVFDHQLEVDVVWDAEISVSAKLKGKAREKFKKDFLGEMV